MNAERDTLGTVQAISTIISAIAIPVIIAAIGWMIQSDLSRDSINKDYVELAVKVLQEKEANNNRELEEWAESIVDENSPFPLTEKARRLRENDDGILVVLHMPSPPDFLLEPPNDLVPLPSKESLTNNDLINNYADNMLVCKTNLSRHIAMQEWISAARNAINKTYDELGLTVIEGGE